MIEARGLTRRYGEMTAVHDVSFSVADGEILGLLGPNGAGKTTTIRMITGFLPPSEGRVTLAGEDLHADPVAARRKLGYLPENVALYTEMRVVEYLRYRAKLAGLGRGRIRQAIDGAIDACLLDGVRYQIIGTLSKGYRQRVGLAAAILHGPQVLVLDEPTVGLDPKQIIAIRELIRDLGRERTLLLSTHILPEVEQLCDRVVIIDRGSLVAEGTPAQLANQTREHRLISVAVKHGDAEKAARVFAELPGMALDAAADGGEDADAGPPGRFQLRADGDGPGTDVDPRERVFRAAVDHGLVLLELGEERVSLEDVFVRLTTSQATAPDDGPPVDDAADDAADSPGEDD
ncbi:MAG: ABC transporter ATP-binding protein [Acidobacteriota bacterium]